MATARTAAIPAQVSVVTEKPGVVMVEAIATAERQNDGRPIAGFFVRRRYQGDRFMIADPSEFSPRWMRFVDEPPKEWHEALKKVLKDVSIEDCMAEPVEAQPRSPERPFSMAEMARNSREPREMDYASGKIKPQRTQA